MTQRGDIGRQQASYRRGLVLGFTVAESLLLILFALMLALGVILVKRKAEAAKLTTEISSLRDQSALLEAKVEVLDALARNKPTDEFFKELVQARALAKEVAEHQKQIEQREKSVSQLERLAESLRNEPNPKAKISELAAEGARLREELKKADTKATGAPPYDLIPDAVALAQAARDAGQSPSETRSMLKDAQKSARENATLRGQVTKLRKDLRSVGRGGDYPPCWITEKGEIEYLFDISLNGEGTLTVKDATPPSRILDRRDLPIPPQIYGEVGRAQFLSMTEKLLALSNARSCRFYVIARDRTSSTQKDLFKTLLINTVEARFYKVIRQ